MVSGISTLFEQPSRENLLCIAFGLYGLKAAVMFPDEGGLFCRGVTTLT